MRRVRPTTSLFQTLFSSRQTNVIKSVHAAVYTSAFIPLQLGSVNARFTGKVCVDMDPYRVYIYIFFFCTFRNQPETIDYTARGVDNGVLGFFRGIKEDIACR